MNKSLQTTWHIYSQDRICGHGNNIHKYMYVKHNRTILMKYKHLQYYDLTCIVVDREHIADDWKYNLTSNNKYSYYIQLQKQNCNQTYRQTSNTRCEVIYVQLGLNELTTCIWEKKSGMLQIFYTKIIDISLTSCNLWPVGKYNGSQMPGLPVWLFAFLVRWWWWDLASCLVVGALARHLAVGCVARIQTGWLVRDDPCSGITLRPIGPLASAPGTLGNLLAPGTDLVWKGCDEKMKMKPIAFKPLI